MFFKVDYVNHDTCGNSWQNKEPDYYEKDNLVELWKKLNSPKIFGYKIDEKWIRKSRTPKGQVYGTWENNPNFDWEKDKFLATAFEFSNGFSSTEVSTLNVN